MNARSSWRRVTRCLAAAALVCGLAPHVAQAQETAPRLVTAVGHGETMTAPDRAVVLVTIRAEGKSAADAAKSAAVRSAQVLEALRGRLSGADRAETASTSVQPIRVYDQGKPPRVTGYAAEHQLRAVTARIHEIGPLLDAVTGAADVSVGSVQFELADPGQAQANALRLAAADAKTRARAIAEGLGLALGPARAAREVGGAPSPRPFDLQRRSVAEATAQTEVLAPELRLTGEVEVSFELVSGPKP
ncbi:MAG: SIMPL domain-containing protein [Deltaproteobacteria bacterium]|nr:SIMPL domain-containing protein [Deltaproteobacteria bacterium]